jgi:hypothetical protein
LCRNAEGRGDPFDFSRFVALVPGHRFRAYVITSFYFGSPKYFPRWPLLLSGTLQIIDFLAGPPLAG